MAEQACQPLNYKIIVATDKFHGIARQDKVNGVAGPSKIPWKCSSDLIFFRKKTVGYGHNAVIMGRKTYESLPEEYLPLPNRHCFVLSKSWDSKRNIDNSLTVVASWDDLWLELQKHKFDTIFVAGGEDIYRQALNKFPEYCTKIYLTILHKDHKCNMFFFYKFADYDIKKAVKTDEYDRFTLERKP